MVSILSRCPYKVILSRDNILGITAMLVTINKTFLICLFCLCSGILISQTLNFANLLDKLNYNVKVIPPPPPPPPLRQAILPRILKLPSFSNQFLSSLEVPKIKIPLYIYLYLLVANHLFQLMKCMYSAGIHKFGISYVLIPQNLYCF